jgi:glutaredoxin 3
MQPRVLMYCTRICPYCVMASRLLESKGVEIDKIHVDDQPERRTEMQRLSGRHTVPQIFIGDQHVGGYTDLAELDREGELDGLLGRG